ncbi:hypothetical protein HYY75_03560 [bacterium]|nr:hypothetical protein [bacterium]
MQKNLFPFIFKKGQAIIVILMIALILGILIGAVMNFQTGQIHLLSKSAKDYLALCAAEAGMNCVLAEMKGNPQFVTHGNPYIPQSDWSSPAKHRPYLVGEVEGLELDHPSKGTYTGRTVMKTTRIVGEFKVRLRLEKAKNSLETKTIDESHRYFFLEAVGRVNDSYRKITAILEKHSPAAYLLYDGQVLDLGGFGPYRLTPGKLRQGRLYGQEMLKISKRGLFDSGIDLLDMEKVSTPGHLSVDYDAYIRFRNGKDGRLKHKTDSSNFEQFEMFPESSSKPNLGRFVLDGAHGSKSEKFPALNSGYYKDATDPHPTILSPSCGYKGFRQSKWRNPAKPLEVVYDLDFGWEYKDKEEKVLLYSQVPLRMWGCPPNKSTTIFCEKDVYIAGDFNANPKNPQNYDMGYQEYSDTPENGTDKNGVMVLSQGRIWFDYSHPILFLRNEMHTLLDYEIAMRLGGKDINPVALVPLVYPPRFNTDSDPRLPLTALSFKVISNLFALPKEPPAIIPVTLAGIMMHPSLKELREYFSPSKKPEEYKQRFCIKSFKERQKIIAKIGSVCYMTGFLTKGERDWVIRSVLDCAQREELEGEPDPALGPWNVADSLFKLSVTHPKLGFRFPEMTVNALLIDSGELNARWETSVGTQKVLNEIGNIQSLEARCFPFIGKDSRMILRHMGGMIHLRTRPAEPFLDGKLRNDFFVVRRLVWDSTFVSGGGPYFPRYMPSAFSVVNWQDFTSSAAEFKSF